MNNPTDYEVIAVVGTGSTGTCFKVRHKVTKEIFAWKAVEYEEQDESILSEIDILRQVQHPNIVQHFGYVINKDIQTVYIVMEYCEGGDLSHLIEKCKAQNCLLLEDFIWRVLYQLCRALQTCHTKLKKGSLLHRDIKPANVFIDSAGNVKLGDFGLAKLLAGGDVFTRSVVGTPYYMSPEIVKGKKYNGKSDIWALGCLIYEMCSLRPPFNGSHVKQLYQNISEGVFSRIPKNYSSDLQHIISFMLKIKNDERPNIEVILRHPSLASHISGKVIPFPPFVFDGSCKGPKQKLTFSPNPDFSSTAVLHDLSCVSTPVLRSQLFGSTYKKLSNRTFSNPEISIINDKVAHRDEPSTVTQNIFNQALKKRLHAIRAQESLLNQKEEELKTKELELNERAKRLLQKEKSVESTLRRASSKRKSKKLVPKCRLPYDDIENTLVPNDTIIEPTVAKLDLATMPPPKALTYKNYSPHKLTQYNIENLPLHRCSNNTRQIRKSVRFQSSKVSDDLEKPQLRKSVFSMFTLNHISKKHNETKKEYIQEPPVTSKWTNEHKKAAFKILAEMNASNNVRKRQEP